MKLTFIILSLMISCSNYNERRMYELYENMKDSECLEMFWGSSILKRGNIYFFIENDIKQIIELDTINNTVKLDSIIFLSEDIKDTSYHYLQKKFNSETEKYKLIINCLNTLGVGNIRGFENENERILEFIANKYLAMYYIPDSEKLEAKKKDWLKNNATKLDNNWYGYIKEKEYSPTIWGMKE